MALADPRQAHVPVLMTMASATGFRSLGPFNHAFKAKAGITLSEYRRLNLRKRATIAESASRFRIRPARFRIRREATWPFTRLA